MEMDEEDYGIFDPDVIGLSDDQMRATAGIPFSDTAKAIRKMIDGYPLSMELQTGLKQLALSYLSRDAIFAHNASIANMMRAYDINAISLDFLKSPKDAECTELPPFMRNIRFLVNARATRTTGEGDERTRQYHPTQRVEQVQRVIREPPRERQPEPDEGGI